MRFLPVGWLIPVLPPTLESTIASSEVGICTKPTPRSTVAAMNPARSPTTPPPSEHQIAAFDAVCQHLVVEVFRTRETFARLSRRHNCSLDANTGGFQNLRDIVPVRGIDVFVGDDPDRSRSWPSLANELTRKTANAGFDEISDMPEGASSCTDGVGSPS